MKNVYKLFHMQGIITQEIKVVKELDHKNDLVGRKKKKRGNNETEGDYWHVYTLKQNSLFRRCKEKGDVRKNN